jgi:putative transposase
MTRREFHPPHIYLDDTCYFLTASIAGRRPLLDTDAKRILVRDVLKETVEQYAVRLYAWVILANHYHLLLKTADGVPIHRFVKRLHGASAIRLNKHDCTPGRKVWYQYWDRFPRNEEDFWSYFNYIHVNPLKHGYVQLSGSPDLGGQAGIPAGRAADVHDLLALYPHSSYQYYLRTYGEDFLTDVWLRYPIPDYSSIDDF